PQVMPGFSVGQSATIRYGFAIVVSARFDNCSSARNVASGCASATDADANAARHAATLRALAAAREVSFVVIMVSVDGRLPDRSRLPWISCDARGSGCSRT